MKKLTLNRMLVKKAHERLKAIGVPYKDRQRVLRLSFKQIREEYLARHNKKERAGG